MSVIRVAAAGSALAAQRTVAPPPRGAGGRTRSIGPAAIVAVRAHLLSGTDSTQDRTPVREPTATDALGNPALQRVRELLKPGLNTIKTEQAAARATVETVESAKALQATLPGLPVTTATTVDQISAQLQPSDPAVSAHQLALDVAGALPRRTTDLQRMQAAQLHSRAAMQILG